MRRPLLIGLLTFGTVFGFGSGIFSMARHAHHHHHHRRAAFERHVADVCVDAALRARPPRGRQVAPTRSVDTPIDL